MSDVLADDAEQTPVREAPADGFYCDQPGCEKGPFKSKGALGGHMFMSHGIRVGKKAEREKAPPPKLSPAGKAPGKPLASRLEGSFGIIGVGVAVLEPYDGRCVTAGAHDLGVSLEALTEAYPETRKYVEMLCLDSPALAVVLAVLPIVLPILKHHGVIRIPLPGPYAGPTDTEPKATPAGGPSSPGGPGVDLTALLGMLPPDMRAPMQGTAAAPRPMGEGAPPSAGPEPGPQPAPSAEDEAPSFEDGVAT